MFPDFKWNSPYVKHTHVIKKGQLTPKKGSEAWFQTDSGDSLIRVEFWPLIGGQAWLL